MEITESVVGRFHQGYSKDGGGCWAWKAAKNDLGYGQLWVKPKVEYAHRVSYTLYRGDIPGGKQVNHHCDNPGCVNPTHLYAGTKADNTADARKRDRLSVGEDHPDSKLNREQVIEIRQRYNAEDISERALAKDYPVSNSQIHNIVSGKRWKHV